MTYIHDIYTYIYIYIYIYIDIYINITHTYIYTWYIYKYIYKKKTKTFIYPRVIFHTSKTLKTLVHDIQSLYKYIYT